jgi:hypothetical protein
LADLNAQAEAWCLGAAAERRCPEDNTLSVGEAFAQEQPRLLALPDNPFPTEERIEVKATKTPYVRFDLNDYSIPHTHIRRLLTVVADPERVRVLDGQQVLACHVRSYDRGAQIEDPAHIQRLVEQKQQASQHRGTDRLTQAAPASRLLLTQAAERGYRLGTITRQLLELLERYGAEPLQTAIEEAISRGVPHPNAVRLALEQRRQAQQLPPPIAAPLSPAAQQRDVLVQPHRLDGYDQLTGDPL